MSFTTVFQDYSNQTSIKRKGTLRGLKAKKIQTTWCQRQDPSIKIPLGANIRDVRAHRSASILTAVFVAQVAQAVEVVVECETVVAPVSARSQRQMAITLDCLEGRRPETPYDWDAMEFVEDMQEIETDLELEAGPLSRNSFFASYASRLKAFVDEL